MMTEPTKQKHVFVNLRTLAPGHPRAAILEACLMHFWIDHEQADEDFAPGDSGKLEKEARRRAKAPVLELTTLAHNFYFPAGAQVEYGAVTSQGGLIELVETVSNQTGTKIAGLKDGLRRAGRRSNGASMLDVTNDLASSNQELRVWSVNGSDLALLRWHMATLKYDMEVTPFWTHEQERSYEQVMRRAGKTRSKGQRGYLSLEEDTRRIVKNLSDMPLEDWDF